jgi:hypothetical protein
LNRGVPPWYKTRSGPADAQERSGRAKTKVAEPIRIEAPDALLGFLLMQRLPHFDAHVHTDGGGWAVAIDPGGEEPEDLFADLLGTIRQWLRDEQLPRTTAHVGERAITVAADDHSP